MKNKLIIILFAILLLASFVSAASWSKAQFRVINVAPGDNYSVFINGELYFNDLAYQEVPFFTVLDPHVDYLVQVKNSNNVIVSEQTISFKPFKDYTMFLYGSPVSSIIKQDGASQGSPKRTRIRFLHAAQGRGALDVSLVNNKFVDTVVYGQLASYNQLLPGQYFVEVRNKDQSPVLLSLNSGPLEAGASYTVVITEDSGLEAFVVLDRRK